MEGGERRRFDIELTFILILNIDQEGSKGRREVSISDLSEETRYVQPGKQSVEPHTEPEIFR